MYRKSKCSDRLYYLTVDAAHCTVWFEEEGEEEGGRAKTVAEVLRVRPAEKVEAKCEEA